MPIRSVLFDVDDTLVDFSASAAAGLAIVLGEAGDRPGLAAAWHELSEHHYPRFLAGEVSFADMQVQRLAAVLEWAAVTVPTRSDLLELESRRQLAMSVSYRLFPDVQPCLDALRATGTLRLGALSNSDGPHQRAKLSAVGLDDAFEVVVISGDVGFAKPDPRIFDVACRRLGEPGAAVAYVGDRWDTDAAAAAAAGLTGIWLRRPGAGRPDPAPADVAGVHTISTLDELPELLAGL